MARPSHLSLRLSPEERTRFLTLAMSRGISLAEWVRDAANRRAEIEEGKDKNQEVKGSDPVISYGARHLEGGS